MTTRSRIQPGDGDSRHGTLNGYTNLYCRCGACCAANTAAVRKHRARRAAEATTMVLPHGRPSTYIEWGCRCEDCTDGMRRRRHARQVAQ